ncbi:porin [Thermodesulfobacteriota bacterium]
MKSSIFIGIFVVLVSFVFPLSVLGYDLSDKVSIGGILAAAYQYMDLKNEWNANDGGGGAIPFQPELRFSPTQNDKFLVKLGFAAGNSLNEKSPFNLDPWAAELEDVVNNINGTNRDYLLTAWYRHTFKISATTSLALSGGLIDATDYLGQNAFAEDPFTQFMNEALANANNVFFPSFDIGGALEWEHGGFNLAAAVLSVAENDEGNSYRFYGLQLGYTLKTSLGEGNYRVIVDATSKDFQASDGRGQKKGSRDVTLSFDQEFNKIFGGWLRTSRLDDSISVDYARLYSGGINMRGMLWGRERDNLGIGYAYLYGGNKTVDYSHVAEIYSRFVLSDFFAATLDVQYMRDKLYKGEGPEGFIYGVRLAVEF